MNNTIKTLVVLLVILLLLGFMYFGYTLINKAPETSSDTVYVYDTVFHSMPVDTLLIPSDTINHYITDTLMIPVDTAAIVADYIKEYRYDWIKKDSNIIIKGSTSVFQNRIKSNKIDYRWLQPQQITTNLVQNNTYYSTYFSIGLDVPIKQPELIEIESIIHYKKGYIGAGYTFNIQSFNLKIGYNLLYRKGRGVLK